MCGKFTTMFSWRQLHTFANFLQVNGDVRETTTPMRFAPIIHIDAQGQRAVSPMRWGFSDMRASSPTERPKHMHARSETIDTLPTFASAFAQARGIVAVNTFNEGEELPNGKTKQWTVTPRDRRAPLGIAVIYERWVHQDCQEMMAFVMVTTPANTLLSKITDRMPAILSPDQWDIWLGETAAPLRDIKAVLRTTEGDWTMQPQSSPAQSGRSKKPNDQSELF